VLTPPLLAEFSNIPCEAGEGLLDPVPICVALLDDSLIRTFGCFPTGRAHWMNVKGSDVICANKRCSE